MDSLDSHNPESEARSSLDSDLPVSRQTVRLLGEGGGAWWERKQTCRCMFADDVSRAPRHTEAAACSALSCVLRCVDCLRVALYAA